MLAAMPLPIFRFVCLIIADFRRYRADSQMG